ncbi:hypothetical protein J5J83_12075 [Azoarcus sp. L1K30]|uniref:putative 2OG-Fe(II) oxygenase n=1 Tax=Azoarcus sp. L1K30 TaxID=2820277 RepID=UPI001B81B798|nr:putative 2OG-Fe(II) oxygenase [Azoarcus sp. L1K30]MBR0566851.1 hypothetical protein [Azoarcus sp. L1K30]
MSQPEVIGIFPVPIMRVPSVLDEALVTGLVEHFSVLATQENNASDNLVHTAMLRPSDSPLLVEAAARVTPAVIEFGALLFGERLGWSLKEMWVNVMGFGGRQAMHNHANSFISGVIYLTEIHRESRTMFMKSPGGVEFSFKNDHAGVVTGPYNGEKWISPQPQPGDLVLFPSYLMHAVPPNRGEVRMTMPFNAIPTRLDSWGYQVSFSG